MQTIAQCDPHRRANDERHAMAQIARDGQRKRNKAEWLRRAIAAIQVDNLELARNLIAQAEAA